FYTLLAGMVPFPVATTRQKLAAHRDEPFPDIRQHVPQMPKEVVRLLGAMGAKDPAKRPSSMAEVARSLEKFSEQPSISFDFDRILAHRAALARKRYPHNPSGAQLAGPGSPRVGPASSTGGLPAQERGDAPPL
ncbi:MAG: hypothetical protein ACK5V1_12795, partial [Planctomycetaceae bacterium]